MNEESTVTRPPDEPSPPEAVATKPRRFWLPLVLALLVGVLALGLLLNTPSPATKPAAASAAVTPPGLQDQIDALRLRVIVLEAQAAAAPPAVKVSASAPRANAALHAAPAEISATEPLPAVAPISRQSIDQFRALLRTPQPDQE